MPYIAYRLTENARQNLLKKFPPKYPCVKYDHITIQMCELDTPLPKPAESIRLRGIADDGNGLQVFLVKVNGSVIRPIDGLFWHMTASYDSHKKAPACFDYQSPKKEQKESPYRAKTSNGFLFQILDARGNLKPVQNPKWLVQLFEKEIEIETTVQKQLCSSELKIHKHQKTK